MPDAYTPNIGLTKPEIGASRDSWGAKLNADLDILDEYVSVAMPIGAVLDFAGPQAPPGWLICDGRAVSRTTYSALFAVIGSYWGTGDGSTTFNLPNTNGRSSVGPGTVTDAGGRSRAFTFGAQNLGYVWNVITQATLPNYALTTNVSGSHSHGGATVAAGAHYHTTDGAGAHSHGGATGGGGAHNHTGYTDIQGVHQHFVTAAYMGAGGNTFSGTAQSIQNTGLYTDAAGAHQHNIQTADQGPHTHTIQTEPWHYHSTTWVGDHTHGISADPGHAHSVYLAGGGGLFEVLGPVIVMTKIIHAGHQAVPAVMTDAAAVTAEQDELAAIREEIEQLRALVFARRPLRHMSAPSRGMH